MLASSVFFETSIPNTPSITVLSFHFISSARAPLRTTLYAGSTLTRVPRYRPAWTAELGKRGLIYRTGSFAKGTIEAHRSPRCSAKCVYSPRICNVQGDDVGRLGNDEFAGAGDAAGRAELRIFREQVLNT